MESQETDEAIVLLIQKGDIDAFGILVDRYEAKLYRYGRKFISRDEDIEDIVQDVFMKAYQNIQGFDTSLRVSPWLYRIAHNAFVNALRKSGRMLFGYDLDTFLSHEVQQNEKEGAIEQDEIRASLEVGLAKVSPKYREILTLHYYEDLPYKDIADVLQIPLGTVSVRMRRAKEKLRKVIEERTHL